MPHEDVPVMDDLLRSSGSSTASLEHIRSVESMSNRSSSTSMNNSYHSAGFRYYVELPQLEPLSFATTEPMLDDLLLKVAETEDLKTLERVHLKISSTMICIQHLEVFLPNLVALDLDGSELSSLRDLGIHLRIKTLNVSRCGLYNLDGTTGLTTLVELVADENHIRSVGQLCNLGELQKLSLRRNRISTFGAVSFMSLCPSILDLDLRDNVVATLAEYRATVRDMMPQLKILDGEAFYDAPNGDESLSSSDYCSSATTSTSEQLGAAKRCTSTEFEQLTGASRNVFGLRSGTTSAQSGSMGSSVAPRIDITHESQPFAGNIVAAVRRRKTAWATRSNSSASSNAGATSSLSSRSSSSMSEPFAQAQ